MSFDLDDLADKTLLLLLEEPEFIAELEKKVQQRVTQSEKDGADVSRRDSLYEVLAELIRVVDAASQAFMSAADSVFAHNETQHNRDASQVFAARLQFDRLDAKLTQERLEVCARRLIQLTRIFSSRFASSLHLSHTSSFASAICEMLFRLEDSLRKLEGRQQIAADVRRCVDDFNEIVVEKLAKLLHKWEKSQKRKENEVPRPVFHTPQTRKRRPLVQVSTRSPGYLMSPGLVKDRQRIARTRTASPSCSVALPPRNKMTSSTTRSNTRTRTPVGMRGLSKSEAAVSMERKWAPLLAAEKTLRQSVGSGPGKGRSQGDGGRHSQNTNMSLARRVSAEVVRELRRNMTPAGILVLD